MSTENENAHSIRSVMYEKHLVEPNGFYFFSEWMYFQWDKCPKCLKISRVRPHMSQYLLHIA